MSTSNIDVLALESRTKTGSSPARALRRNGKVPGILFGHGTPGLPIAVDARALDTILHTSGKSHLLTISIDGTTKDTALLRDLQRDPVTHRVTHADLQRVSATESIHATLRIATIGTAYGVLHGGVLDIILYDIEVQGPANALPEKIEIDVTSLGVHDHIAAADVKLPTGFKMLTPPETIIITIEASRTAAEVEIAAPAVSTPVPTVAETKGEAKGEAKGETKIENKKGA
jgi:large subunit ribosomal protein L25